MPPDYFEVNTDKFKELLDKFEPQISLYLKKRVELFIRAFLIDNCRVPEKDTDSSSSKKNAVDRIDRSWYWSRVEFTSTRGIMHQHTIAKLPFVLETSILARMVQNMRIVREELKFKNIKDYDKAWRIIKCGLLTSCYLVLFANLVSTCSFFTDNIDNDHFDESKVIDLDSI